jgi:NADP-dependent 3-hydroxy acid dehydrogenase YdfG
MTSATTSVSTRRELELAGQTVVLIGGSAGIGLEAARRARAEGASVVLTGRDPDRLEQAALEVGAERTAAFDATDTAVLARLNCERHSRSAASPAPPTSPRSPSTS